MGKIWLSIKHHYRLAFLVLGFIFFVHRSDHPPGDRTQEVRAFTRQIEFDFVTWTLDAVLVKGSQAGLGATDYIPPAEHAQIVLDYLQLVRDSWKMEWQIDNIYADPEISDPETDSQDLRQALEELNRNKDFLAPVAESVIQNQLSILLGELELSFGGQPLPPVLYHVTPLPKALIVSPREVIQRDAHVSLQAELTIDERTALEDQIDAALDVSSLVVNVGGVGAYPTMVMETASINWLAEVVSHEWVHNFLTFRPLGLSYGTSNELRVINETVANMADKEIGALLIERFYPEFVPPPPAPPPEDTAETETQEPEPPVFDFRAAMHETRITTDELLAAGKIEEAEAYLEARRQFFWENGYRIRKLNQAYFAFHGAYADQPGGAAGAAEDPIGDAIRSFRAQSTSISEFLNHISWMWSLEQIESALK